MLATFYTSSISSCSSILLFAQWMNKGLTNLKKPMSVHVKFKIYYIRIPKDFQPCLNCLWHFHFLLIFKIKYLNNCSSSAVQNGRDMLNTELCADSKPTPRDSLKHLLISCCISKSRLKLGKAIQGYSHIM